MCANVNSTGCECWDSDKDQRLPNSSNKKNGFVEKSRHKRGSFELGRVFVIFVFVFVIVIFVFVFVIFVFVFVIVFLLSGSFELGRGRVAASEEFFCDSAPGFYVHTGRWNS